nr:hypothetical protein [Pseudarthrobacter sulfonivorans]
MHLAIDAMDLAKRASLEERVVTDIEFHRTMFRLTGNEILFH